MSELQHLLNDGIAQLNLTLPESTLKNILLYVDYLAQWNQTYNLTAIRNKEDMIVKHVLDSLSLCPFVKGHRCIDVGTGPGLPGIMLALALPDIEFVLLDSQIKKIQFIKRVLREIPLSNVSTAHQRAQDHKPAHLYDIIITRAFSSLQNMIACTEHLRAPQGYYLAMKGLWPQDEIAQIEDRFSITVNALDVPFLQGERHVIIIHDSALD